MPVVTNNTVAVNDSFKPGSDRVEMQWRIALTVANLLPHRSRRRGRSSPVIGTANRQRCYQIDMEASLLAVPIAADDECLTWCVSTPGGTVPGFVDEGVRSTIERL